MAKVSTTLEPFSHITDSATGVLSFAMRPFVFFGENKHSFGKTQNTAIKHAETKKIKTHLVPIHNKSETIYTG